MKSRGVGLSELRGDVDINSRGVYWLMNMIAIHARTYKNKSKYAGLRNLQTTIYFLPNNIKPNIRIIQNEKAKAVLTKNGSSR